MAAKAKNAIITPPRFPTKSRAIKNTAVTKRGYLTHSKDGQKEMIWKKFLTTGVNRKIKIAASMNKKVEVTTPMPGW
jgi:hypothetical protein